MTLNVLFLCSRSRLRSPTAEQVFADWPGILTASAGVNRDADNPVTAELLDWADLVFVMEATQRTRLATRFPRSRGRCPVICLDLPDDFTCMAPALVALLHKRGQASATGACRRP